MRFPLRAKFFLFATLAAVAPLALVAREPDAHHPGRAEERRERAADRGRRPRSRRSIDQAFWGRWLAPAPAVRNAVDSPELGVPREDRRPDPRPLLDPRRGRAAPDASATATCRCWSPTRPSPPGWPRPASTRSRRSSDRRRRGRGGAAPPPRPRPRSQRIEATGAWLVTRRPAARHRVLRPARHPLGPDRALAARDPDRRASVHPPRRDHGDRRRRPERARAGDRATSAGAPSSPRRSS